MEDRKQLAKLICEATQKTNYECINICEDKGCCAYCLTIAEHILQNSNK